MIKFMHMKKNDKRAVGIVMRNNQIILIRRFWRNREYYVFPGGGVESGETEEEAVIREIKEELSIDAKINKFLFKVFNPKNVREIDGRDDYFFLITEFSGEPTLGGPEKARMNKDDQFYLEWHDISELPKMDTLVPEHERLTVYEILSSSM